MYIPSFFAGHLIVRFGAIKIMTAGLAILGLAGIIALSGVTLSNFLIALIFLGVGWNFGFVGATSLLAALASGGLMNCSGGTPVAGWNAVNFAMIPFLMLAGGALIWLVMQNGRTQRSI